jgi:hypothetical protein
MHKIKEMLMNELYEYEEKAKKSSGSVSTQELDRIHKLTDTIKNIDKIEMLEDGGYSEDTDFMGEGRMYGTSYDGGSSYARGRGRNARRDSMGRYSRDSGTGGNMGGNPGDGNYSRNYSRDDPVDHMMNKMESMLRNAGSEEERRAIQKCMKLLEDA